ncbi:hypothetical protein GCM10023063_24340 [Arthrobacter methylotrophus]
MCPPAPLPEGTRFPSQRHGRPRAGQATALFSCFLNFGMGINQLRRDKTTLGCQSHFTYGKPFEPVPGKAMAARYVT